jgi:hypothetical protein
VVGWHRPDFAGTGVGGPHRVVVGPESCGWRQQLAVLKRKRPRLEQPGSAVLDERTLVNIPQRLLANPAVPNPNLLTRMHRELG